MKRAILVTMAGLLVLYGCKEKEQEITLKLDEAGHPAPVLRPGDIVNWDSTSAKWVFDESPCEEGSGPTKKCTIVKKPEGQLYSYHCLDRPCDPEILVDDGVRAQRQALISTDAPTPINVGCVKGKSLIEDPTTVTVHPDEVIRWVISGNSSGMDTTMEIKFRNDGDQGKICTKTDPINRNNPDCTVKMSPMTVEYQVKVGSCPYSLDYGTLKY